MRTVNIGTVSNPAANTLLYNFLHTIGGSTLNTDEGAAAIRSFNRYAKKAANEMRWPQRTICKQVIPDVRVRAVSVGSGGSGYSSAPTVTIAAPASGTQATATATIDGDGVVNGISVTNEGSGYTQAPAVSFSSGGGSGATATSVIVGYIDYGSTVGATATISDLLRVTESDPLTSAYAPTEIPFKVMHDASSGYGEALLINRNSTSPVWATYRYAEDVYVATGSETGNQKGAIPYVWAEYVVMGAYVDWLRSEEQHSQAAMVKQEADQILLMEIDKLERQGSQEQFTQYQSHHITGNFSN